MSLRTTYDKRFSMKQAPRRIHLYIAPGLVSFFEVFPRFILFIRGEAAWREHGRCCTKFKWKRKINRCFLRVSGHHFTPWTSKCEPIKHKTCPVLIIHSFQDLRFCCSINLQLSKLKQIDFICNEELESKRANIESKPNAGASERMKNMLSEQLNEAHLHG